MEDINLIRSAAIPITEEVGTFSGASREIDRTHLERELRAHGRRVEQLLASIADKANLRWTFRSTRGLIHRELLNAAVSSDLIILGKSGWSGRKRIGSTARAVVMHSPVQSLILMHKVRPDTPVMVLYDGSPTSKHALSAARRLLHPESSLTVLINAKDRKSAEKLQKEIMEILREDDLNINFRWSADIRGDRISHLAQISNCDVVVLPAQSEVFDPETLISMLERADCAVLLVR